ncbi:hypothetical protein MTO96_030397 [Rhipicephalus appendiculatus]
MAHERRRVQGWSTELLGITVVLYKLEVENAVTRVGDHQINFGHYVTLFDTEKDKHLRVVPKLTRAHVAPDNLQKMSVRLATQLFSRSTAVGIKLYREAKVPGMENSEGTETFTRMVNDLFDALNIKLPSRGVRRHSKEIQHMSVQLKAIFSDTFGLARSFRGDESHPTVVNFSQIFRLLSVYTPIKTALRGSVQGTPCSVLISVTDTLKRTKDAHQEEKVRLHDIVEAKMMEITTASADASEQGPSDHAYYRGDVEDTVVFYLCGYVIHKFTKHATCHLCIEDISSATPVLASDSYLTDYRSFKQGSLKHPTQKMLKFMKIANKIISACLDKEGLCGDIFWKALEKLEEHHLSRLGCDQHNAAFTCQVCIHPHVFLLAGCEPPSGKQRKTGSVVAGLPRVPDSHYSLVSRAVPAHAACRVQSSGPCRRSDAARRHNNVATRMGLFSVMAAAIKNPNPQVWFHQVEAQFSLYRIASETTRYYHVASVLPPDVASELSDVLSNLSDTTPYQHLKTKAFAPGQPEYVQAVGQGAQYGGAKISQGRSKPGTVTSQQRFRRAMTSQKFRKEKMATFRHSHCRGSVLQLQMRSFKASYSLKRVSAAEADIITRISEIVQPEVGVAQSVTLGDISQRCAARPPLSRACLRGDAVDVVPEHQASTQVDVASSSSVSSSDHPSAYVLTVGTASRKDLVVHAVVDGVTPQLLVDTGASVSLMTVEDFQRHFNKQLSVPFMTTGSTPHELGVMETEMRPGKDGVEFMASSRKGLERLEDLIENDDELRAKLKTRQPKGKILEVKIIGIDEDIGNEEISRKIIQQNGLNCTNEGVRISKT